MTERQGVYVHEIRKALSHERLDAYGIARTDEEKIANYLWNLALSESLYPAPHGLEVAMRNTVFSAGSAVFAGVATRDVPCWLDADPPIVHPDDLAAVVAAKERLRERGLPLEPGRLATTSWRTAAPSFFAAFHAVSQAALPAAESRPPPREPDLSS